MMPHLFPLLAAASLLLSSCVHPSCLLVNWHIGENIRLAGEKHIGVEVTQPVDGKIYRPRGEDAWGTAYLYAPEIRYTLGTTLVDSACFGIIWGGGSLFVREMEPTGQVHLVRAWRTRSRATRFEQTVEAIPPGCEPLSVPEEPHRIFADVTYGSLSHTEVGLGRTLAAAPFDYVIDPLLTVGSTALTLGGAVLALPVCGVLMLWHDISEELASE